MSLGNQILAEIRELNKKQNQLIQNMVYINDCISAMKNEIKDLAHPDVVLERELIDDSTFKLLKINNIAPDGTPIAFSKKKEHISLNTKKEYQNYIRTACKQKQLYTEVFEARNQGYSIKQIVEHGDPKLPSLKRLEKTISALNRCGFLELVDGKMVYDLDNLEEFVFI